MPEAITPESLFNNIIETLSDNVSKHKSTSFFEEDKTSPGSSQFNRIFGRQKPVHYILGGGKSADVLLWRNKKISASVLAAATAIWMLFEWLNYNFLSLMCFTLIIIVIAQFAWSTLSNRSKVPHVVLPNEFFVNIATSLGAEVNRSLKLLQDIACRGNGKQLLSVVGGLLAAAMIGSSCNFLTVLYIGFVAAHTLPVVYERYDDQFDNFTYNLLGLIQHHYGKLDANVLSRIPKGKNRWKKFE